MYKKYAGLCLTHTHENTDLALVELVKFTNMDLIGKTGMDGQVNKVIDQAAGAAKKKINETIGGNASKDKKPAGAAGIGDMVGGAITKAAVDQASGKAADQAVAFGKKLIN